LGDTELDLLFVIDKHSRNRLHLETEMKTRNSSSGASLFAASHSPRLPRQVHSFRFLRWKGAAFGVLVLSCLLLILPSSNAQITFTAGDETVTSGSPVSVSVTVDNFVDVTSAQFSLAWNPLVLEYTSASGDPGFPPAFGAIGDSDADNGFLGLSWAGNQDETVSDGTVMFTINFNAIGANGTGSQISFGDNPTPREVAANGSPTSAEFNGGTVTVAPEPAHTALATAALLVGLGLFMRYRSRKTSSQVDA
jgi:hypothetical protein